jgi:hypothetical protein
VLEWISLADFYTLPHITYFKSFDHLLDMLTDPNIQATLFEQSRLMLVYNEQRVSDVVGQWGGVVEKIRRAKALRTQQGENNIAIRQKEINEMLKLQYGVELTSGCNGHISVS